MVVESFIKAVKVKKALYRNWQKERSKDSWENYNESSQIVDMQRKLYC